MKFTNYCSIHAGMAYRDNVVLITAMNDGLAEARQQHAIPLFYRDGTWMLGKDEKVLPWLVAGIAAANRSSKEFVIVGWAGQVLVVKDQKSYREAISRTDDQVSIIRSVANINDIVYTVGMRRQVHRRLGRDQWEKIDRGITNDGNLPAGGFEAIDGFSNNELYAVGLNGEMWNYDGECWKMTHGLTNLHLHSICCAPNGKVFIGGRAGTIIQGRHDSWDILSNKIDETIWGLKWYQDKLYILSDTSIYRLLNDDIQREENRYIKNRGFHTLCTASGKLWIFGYKNIIRYDGALWSEIDCTMPENNGDGKEVLKFFSDDIRHSGSHYLRDID